MSLVYDFWNVYDLLVLGRLHFGTDFGLAGHPCDTQWSLSTLNECRYGSQRLSGWHSWIVVQGHRVLFRALVSKFPLLFHMRQILLRASFELYSFSPFSQNRASFDP